MAGHAARMAMRIFMVSPVVGNRAKEASPPGCATPKHKLQVLSPSHKCMKDIFISMGALSDLDQCGTGRFEYRKLRWFRSKPLVLSRQTLATPQSSKAIEGRSRLQ
jgi:hypothetical protein